MNIRRTFLLIAGLLTLAALACNFPFVGTPTEPVFPTPDLTMTAVFVGAQTQAVATLVAPTASQSPTVPIFPSPTPTIPPLTATFTASPTSTNPPPPPPPSKTPTQSLAGPGKRPKFPVIAYFVDDPPYIDGELDEWNLDRYNIDSVVYGGRNIEGSSDLSGRAMFIWDDDFLYLGVRVIDDVYAQDARRANLYKGDSLEVLLDADVSSDYYSATLSADDFQLRISPGSPEPGEDLESAYGVQEYDRISVKLTPVNPKNFLFDPNGTCIDDCMGVATERFVSVHKVMEGIQSGKYRKVDLTLATDDEKLEPTQETTQFKDDKVELLTYYGLVPREYLSKLKDDESDPEEDVYGDDVEDYADMVEAIIVIANGSQLLKAEEPPYMMKDRPIISYQDDTVPNRLLGRGVVEKAINMQMAIDGSMRTHLDSLALTAVPMVALDATRLPRGAKFEVKPGKAFLTNGAPQEIIQPFNFGTTDGNALQASKEFEPFAKVRRSDMRLIGFSRGEDAVPGLKASDDWKGMLAGWKRTLDALAKGFASGAAQVDPKAGLETCRRCDLQPLCRVHERLGALQGEAESGEAR